MAAPRPRSVTLACLYAGAGAAFLFVSLTSVLWDWGSVAMQDQIAEMLQEQPLARLDLSVQSVLAILRWVFLAGVVGSIAGMVFAVFTFRGDRSSRIGLTVLCGLAALTFVGLGLAGLLPAMIAAAIIALLWNREARRFFAGEEPPLELGAAPAVQAPRPPAAPSAASSEAVPPPPQVGVRRPGSVTLVLLLTGIGAVIVAAFAAVSLLVVTAGRGEYERALSEEGLTQDLLRSSQINADVAIAIITWSAVVWLVLAVAGVAIALWAATQRSVAARRALFTMAVITLVVSVLFFPLGLPWTAAAIVALVQLSKPDAKTWFSHR